MPNSARFASSLVVSTYNWPVALAVILESVRAQRVLPDEVIVADDGSLDDTRAVVVREAGTFPVPLHHVWHPDEGFRASTIRNKAIATASGEYIVQIDGDMVLHQEFVASHVAFARPNAFVQGGRALLDTARTKACLAGCGVPRHPFVRGVRNRVNAIHLPALSRFAPGSSDPFRRIRGCNMAFWRTDLVRVNGYDEAIQGWGREDNELAVRLVNAGVMRRNLKFAAVAWHLDHPYRSRDDVPRNQTMLERTRDQRTVRCDRGIDQWLHVPGATAIR